MEPVGASNSGMVFVQCSSRGKGGGEPRGVGEAAGAASGSVAWGRGLHFGRAEARTKAGGAAAMDPWWGEETG